MAAEEVMGESGAAGGASVKHFKQSSSSLWVRGVGSGQDSDRPGEDRLVGASCS